MKKRILATVVLSSLLGTGLYAAGPNFGPQGMKNGSFCNPQNRDGKMMKNFHKKGNKGTFGIFRKLNLSVEQKTKIATIRKEVMQKNYATIDTAFTKDSFDKAKFVEIMKQKRDNMLESKAEILEKSYAVLTPKQKEQFKVLLDLQKERRIAMMDNMQKGRGK